MVTYPYWTQSSNLSGVSTGYRRYAMTRVFFLFVEFGPDCSAINEFQPHLT